MLERGNSGSTFDDYRLNQYTKPIHLFIGDDAERTVCGMSPDAANNQDTEMEFDADRFPATNNFESFKQLQEAEDGNDYYCSTCWKIEFGDPFDDPVKRDYISRHA